MSGITDATVSKSRARHLRNVAMKRRMYEDANTQNTSTKTAETLEGLAKKLEVLATQLDGKLQFLLSCCYTGQYESFFPDGCYSATPDQHEPVLSYLNAGAEEFQPVTGIADTHNFVECDFAAPGGTELHMATNDAGDSDTQDQNTLSDDYDISCTACGKAFILPSAEEEYDGDRCDTCGTPCHTYCLREVIELRGAWSLCSLCHGARLNDARTVVGDFRRVPAGFWHHLYKEFRFEDGGNATAQGQEAASPCSPDSSAAPDADSLFKPLDITLDYMLKFLEGEHVKSESISEKNRSTVLGLIKSAMSWKATTQRSSQDVREYTQKLNNVMGEIVRKM